MIGKSISHFQISEKIGAGGMGEIFLAQDIELDRKVALKFLPAHYTADPEINARFKREAKAAAALNHPNIITVYEVGEHEGQTYIAMEYVQGESLKQLISKEALSLEKILELTIQICEGLREAHQAGIVHRDVKPENIVVDQRGTVKILDFGLAKLKNVTLLTKEASTLGTLLYMAPEQLQGMEVDQRADIWSVGVVLYEMITQRLPFQGKYEASLMYSVVHQEPEPITSLRSEVPAKLAQIVSNALVKNADDRYQQIDELLADLQSGDEEMPVVRKGVPTMKAREPGMTSTGRILGAVVSVMIVLAAVAFYFLREEKPTTEKKRVVVAVFENQTGDVALDPLGRMAADWISQGLAQTNLMHVVPTTAVLASLEGLKHDEPGVQAASIVPFLASETKSDIVVSGNFYQQGEMIQFQAQVTDLETKQLLSGMEPIIKSRKEAFSAIAELKQQVMGALAAQVDPRMIEFTQGVGRLPNYEAYKEYVEGLVLLNQHKSHDAQLHFRRAYKLDTTFVTALLYEAQSFLGHNVTQTHSFNS